MRFAYEIYNNLKEKRTHKNSKFFDYLYEDKKLSCCQENVLSYIKTNSLYPNNQGDHFLIWETNINAPHIRMTRDLNTCKTGVILQAFSKKLGEHRSEIYKWDHLNFIPRYYLSKSLFSVDYAKKFCSSPLVKHSFFDGSDNCSETFRYVEPIDKYYQAYKEAKDWCPHDFDPIIKFGDSKGPVIWFKIIENDRLLAIYLKNDNFLTYRPEYLVNEKNFLLKHIQELKLQQGFCKDEKIIKRVIETLDLKYITSKLIGIQPNEIKKVKKFRESLLKFLKEKSSYKYNNIFCDYKFNKPKYDSRLDFNLKKEFQKVDESNHYEKLNLKFVNGYLIENYKENKKIILKKNEIITDNIKYKLEKEKKQYSYRLIGKDEGKFYKNYINEKGNKIINSGLKKYSSRETLYKLYMNWEYKKIQRYKNDKKREKRYYALHLEEDDFLKKLDEKHVVKSKYYKIIKFCKQIKNQEIDTNVYLNKRYAKKKKETLNYRFIDEIVRFEEKTFIKRFYDTILEELINNFTNKKTTNNIYIKNIDKTEIFESIGAQPKKDNYITFEKLLIEDGDRKTLIRCSNNKIKNSKNYKKFILKNLEKYLIKFNLNVDDIVKNYENQDLLTTMIKY